jgi:DNA-binding IscR family transcriptional regulator
MQAVLEDEFRDAEHAMEERLGRTTIAHLVQQTLTRERELAH